MQYDFVGMFNYTGIKYVIYLTECTNCPLGHECSNAAIVPVECVAGTYAVTLSTSCSACDIGYKCPTAGLGIQTPCSTGTYQTATSQTSCITCTAGSWCDSTTSTACISGTYALSGAAGIPRHSHHCCTFVDFTIYFSI